MMQRIPEPELMDEAEQARAYARADFDAPHRFFIDCFQQRFTNKHLHGNVLDLGCGPADISVRFARAYPHCHIDGIDGAEAMLAEGRERLAREQLTERIHLYRVNLPRDTIPLPAYDVIISNSLLHHLHDPQVLWQAVKQHGRPGTPVFIMDLQRPDTPQQARELMQHYAADEPPILQRDFYHSLCAAFTPDEVRQQLHRVGLDYLEVKSVSDRHLVVQGHLGE
ncbi:class I SAM-dependent methyltransferase [Thiohalophilus sp.]|uniref:class I SAM-dependent methyltransferase n=1 Tax=Thiohalophilus sp. TaxID=3028392 RepID=UPI003976060E